MKTLKISFLFISILGVIFLQACNKSLVVKNVNYTQQIESVLIPDIHGNVTDNRYGISYSILDIQFEEFEDTSSVLVNEVRMIRNDQGFYFITADKFKHVYVMAPIKGAFKLENKILINEVGLYSPAFNWRDPLIQLIDRSNNIEILISEKGIYKEGELS